MCLSTRSTSRSGIATSRSGTALAPLPPPPCSIPDDPIVCGDGSGSGATDLIFKLCRGAHTMYLWLPAVRHFMSFGGISQCFGGWSAALYAARRRELGLPGTSPVVKDPLQVQQPPSDERRSHGLISRTRQFIQCASEHIRLILCRNVARRSPLQRQGQCIRSSYALWPARITRGGRAAVRHAPQV